LSIHDAKVTEKLDKETKIHDGHYVVPMIWKPDICMPDSIEVSKRRLLQLVKRFQRDNLYFSMFQKNIIDHLKNSHARKLTEEEASKCTNKTWYVPQHEW